MSTAAVAWGIAVAALAGMLVRPWRSSEWMWIVGGAVAEVASGTISPSLAGVQVARGTNVYAFLIGIVGLAEIARREEVFFGAAAAALAIAGGSRTRLFFLVCGIGALVTMVLSNDTTVVILTPIVLAAMRETDAAPLPYLYACAFVANAASYVLPISNPANLVFFDGALPKLGEWLGRFGLSAAAAIIIVCLLTFLLHLRVLSGRFKLDRDARGPIARGGRVAFAAVALSVCALLVAAATGVPVGPVAFVCAAASLIAVGMKDRAVPEQIVRAIAWQIVPLAAGLFVVVAALDRSGGLMLAERFFEQAAHLAPALSNIDAGAVAGLCANVFNNLFVAMAGGQALPHVTLPQHVVDATLVGIDLGPNLFVTGSLATLLWLITLRRAGIEVTAMQFLKVGAVVVLPAVVVAELLIR